MARLGAARYIRVGGYLVKRVGRLFEQRRAEKASSRRDDERAIASGRKSAPQVGHENATFAKLKVRVVRDPSKRI